MKAALTELGHKGQKHPPPPSPPPPPPLSGSTQRQGRGRETRDAEMKLLAVDQMVIHSNGDGLVSGADRVAESVGYWILTLWAYSLPRTSCRTYIWVRPYTYSSVYYSVDEVSHRTRIHHLILL